MPKDKELEIVEIVFITFVAFTVFATYVRAESNKQKRVSSKCVAIYMYAHCQYRKSNQRFRIEASRVVPVCSLEGITGLTFLSGSSQHTIPH